MDRLEDQRSQPPVLPEQLSDALFALYGEGKFQEVVDRGGALLGEHAGSALLHTILGAAYAGLKHADRAIDHLRRAASITPDSAEAHNNLANSLLSFGRRDDAVASFRRALAIDPANAGVHLHLANILRDLRRMEEAIASYREALAIKPDFAEAHHHLAIALWTVGRIDDAIASLRQTLAIRPDWAEAHNSLSVALERQGKLDEAVTSLGQALALKPGFAEAHFNLGNILKSLDRLDEAVLSYGRAIAIRPDYAGAHSNLGATLQQQGRLDKAEASFGRALAAKPDFAEAHFNLGNVFKELGRLDEAIACYDRALAIRPDYPDAHCNYAHVSLLQGDFERGWPRYEWRKRKLDPNGARSFPQPLWLGDTNIAGKSVFLHHEQGLGDTIQFIRYAALVRDLGARVTVSVQKHLLPLLRDAIEGVAVIGSDEVPDQVDYHAPLLSLPLAFETRLATIPAAVPYLGAEPERVRTWQERLGGHGFKIGICWQGKSGKLLELGRSFPLAQFGAIADLPDVRLISLHKGAGEGQLDGLPGDMRVETLGEDFDPAGAAFLDTAAVMRMCDLVITSDTSVAHLAGALAVPTWVVLEYDPDWRWLLDRDDSPWYPTMRLLRQETRGDWDSAFARAEPMLRDLLDARLPHAPAGQPGTMPRIPASWGEVLDKITILEIKSSQKTSEAVLANVRRELDELRDIVRAQLVMTDETAELRGRLRTVNGALWDIENAIRNKERLQDFGPEFVELARSVYVNNDERARLKRLINLQTSSVLVEEKMYSKYSD